jgi:serine/threonine protein kinase/Tol biopolymer transport system component
MSTRWEDLDRILAEARALPAADQAAFIARTCGADAALGSEAESLLSASNASMDFLERSAMDRLAQAFAADELNLKPGRRIGAYTIVRQLGIGGAGEVWRAKDERLNRDVAIKILLPHLSGDAGKLGRFAEEARAAGTLNHPNIVTVHDVGEHDGMRYLVSECLEGRNLRERIKAGAIPVAEATGVALGIARGLAAAHERGIVHRDLKPENTFLKSDSGVKLLDFGLAKLKLPAASRGEGADDSALSMVAGTAAYMAPEQARGESPDPRADLFALGVMMYEMLAGVHPFRGASVFETLHAILTRDPPDLLDVNERIPPAVARIVMRLLEKAPDARFQSARDLAWSLAQATEISARPSSERAGAQRRDGMRKSTSLLLGASAAIAVVLGAVWWLTHERSRPTPAGALTRFTWKLPEGMALNSAPMVAPDGRSIAFTATNSGGLKLYVRALGSLEARAIAGTDGARLPFWSPDSRTLAYFSDDKLMKVSLPDGAPAAVAEALSGRGGAWTSSGVIVYAPDLIQSALSRVAAEGGTGEAATLLDASRGETAHWWPVALPDGVHFLYFVRSIDADRRGIYLGRVDRPAAVAGERLFYSESGAAFLRHAGSEEADLVYIANGRVESRRFNHVSLTVAAQARTLDFLPAERTIPNPLMVSASDDVMAFADSIVPSGSRLLSVTMDGKGLRLWDKAEAHGWPRVSPDGRLIARSHIDETLSQPDIWVEDLERGTMYPVLKTLEPDMSPVWSPDGRQLAFVTGPLPYRKGKLTLNIVAADGTGIVRSQECPGDFCEPADWSADGSTLLVIVLESGNANVWTISAAADGIAKPLLVADFDETEARYSPNGRWIAYVSRETERPEVMVHAVSGPARRFAVSGEGGTQPVWRRDGRVLYFVDLRGQLRSVAVRWAGHGEPVFGLPTQLELPRIGFGHWGTQYDVSPDGNRIYFTQPTQDPAPTEIQVAINWQLLLD